MDASAGGWGDQTKTAPHPSQVDHKKGFGGKFGVDTEHQDKVLQGVKLLAEY